MPHTYLRIIFKIFGLQKNYLIASPDNLIDPQPNPVSFFLPQQSESNNKFEVGMSLEADDLKKSGKVCVASVTDKIDNRILVHFDGWDERYDYWVDIRSPYIHHINWHQENGYSITAPPGWFF